jgi:hypothetical protein
MCLDIEFLEYITDNFEELNFNRDVENLPRDVNDEVLIKKFADLNQSIPIQSSLNMTLIEHSFSEIYGLPHNKISFIGFFLSEENPPQITNEEFRELGQFFSLCFYTEGFNFQNLWLLNYQFDIDEPSLRIDELGDEQRIITTQLIAIDNDNFLPIFQIFLQTIRNSPQGHFPTFHPRN